MTRHKRCDQIPEHVVCMYHIVQDMSRQLGPNSWKVFSTNTLRKAEDLMPRDIMSFEPRHWIVFGQLPMPVQCCAEAPALHRHGQLAKYHPVPWLRWHNVSWHQVFCLPEGWGDKCPEIGSSKMQSLNMKFRKIMDLSLIHIWRCRRSYACRSRWSPYH